MTDETHERHTVSDDNKNKTIEPFNLIDLDITELERRLELAPNECDVAPSFSGGCKVECKEFKVKVG